MAMLRRMNEGYLRMDNAIIGSEQDFGTYFNLNCFWEARRDIARYGSYIFKSGDLKSFFIEFKNIIEKLISEESSETKTVDEKQAVLLLCKLAVYNINDGEIQKLLEQKTDNIKMDTAVLKPLKNIQGEWVAEYPGCEYGIESFSPSENTGTIRLTNTIIRNASGGLILLRITGKENTVLRTVYLLPDETVSACFTGNQITDIYPSIDCNEDCILYKTTGVNPKWHQVYPIKDNLKSKEISIPLNANATQQKFTSVEGSDFIAVAGERLISNTGILEEIQKRLENRIPVSLIMRDGIYAVLTTTGHLLSNCNFERESVVCFSMDDEYYIYGVTIEGTVVTNNKKLYERLRGLKNIVSLGAGYGSYTAMDIYGNVFSDQTANKPGVVCYFSKYGELCLDSTGHVYELNGRVSPMILDLAVCGSVVAGRLEDGKLFWWDRGDDRIRYFNFKDFSKNNE